MTDPNPPQQPGPYPPPPPPGGGHQPPPYGQQQPPAYGQQLAPPPYGQQPPPYGHQPGNPQDYPPPAPPGTAAKKSKKKVWLTLGTILAVLVVGIAAVAYFNRNSPSSAEAGDCIKVNSASTTSADVEKIDCNDQIAVFKVAKRLGNDSDECPTPDYEKYTQTGGGSDFALCLMLNAREGECFANYDTPDKRARAACGSAEVVKVAKVVAGQADEGACDQESMALVYPEPAITFCLAQP